MSFLNNLAKGFVRSAVNQIGRDGGKIISNNLYGDTYAKPIRETGSKNEKSEFINRYIKIPENNSRVALIEAGYEAAIFKSGFWGSLFALIGSFIIPFIGSIYWLVIGIRNIFKTKTDFYGYEKKPVYKADKRFKTGARHIGYQKVKSYADSSVPATKSERIVYILKGVTALIIAFVTFYFWYIIFENWDSNKTVRIEIIQTENIGIAKTFTDLKKEPHNNSETLITIFSEDTIQLLEETKINADSTEIWYKIKYREKEGWTSNPIKKKKK